MTAFSTFDKKSTSSIATLLWVTIVVGIASGITGMLLAMLLHYLQHLAFGYSPLHIIDNESFLEGVRASSPQRRVVVLTICGVIAGVGWAAIHRFGKPLVSIVEALKTNKIMPPLATILHALLQIITIALGSPLGREVAPREISAVFAAWLSSRAGLSLKQIKIFIACGAGAGLAAVYNVPFGGAIFVAEVLLCSFSWSIIVPALMTSAIAVIVSWWGLGNVPLYHVPELGSNYALIIWSCVTGPVFGVAAFGFMHIATRARAAAPRTWNIILTCLLNFVMIGFFAIYFPSLLGNGKSLAQVEFSNSVGIALSTLLLLLRCIIVWSSLRAGAQGGLLTPSLANGALMGVILGGLWNIMLPTVSVEAFAIIGATAFLATAQKMPITAIVLLFELTRVDLSFLIPMMLAVSGSIGMCHLCKSYFTK